MRSIDASFESAGPLLTSVVARTRGYISQVALSDRKAIAQVFTPLPIAQFMAARVCEIGERFHFIDAGSGVGMLTAAMCERIAPMPKPRSVHAELYEVDPAVRPAAQATMLECQSFLAEHGHDLSITLHDEDFVLRRPTTSLFSPSPQTEYADVVLMNPPYSKLSKDSPQARAFAEIVHGQPNVYALFMAAAVELLRPGGELIAITPRSFCNGLYFREFRRWLLSRMSLRHIHLFESRRATFKDSDVLQESIITVAAKQTKQSPNVLVSCSHGANLEESEATPRSVSSIIHDPCGACVIRFPASPMDLGVIRVVESWSATFAERGLRISTGPVVAFRATKYLLNTMDEGDAIPLFSIHNVRPFATVWPVAKGTKPVGFRATPASAALLIPARNYVFLRRFSAKEEDRRLTASPYIPTEAEKLRPVALENHLNYVTHQERELTSAEVHGLVAVFNSALLDRYFRILSGNTQVNATEIRAIPFPELTAIAEIGERVGSNVGADRAQIDNTVMEVLRVSTSVLNGAAGDAA